MHPYSTWVPKSILSQFLASSVVSVAFVSCNSAHAGALPSELQLLGVSTDGGTFRFNADGTGVVALDHKDGVLLEAMAQSSTGTYVAGARDGRLFYVDASTGELQQRGTPSFGTDETIQGLAFTNDDRLLAIVNRQQDRADLLYEISQDWSTASLIGETGMFGLQSFAIGPDGTGYSFDTGRFGLGLVTVDTSTALASDVNDNVGSLPVSIHALAFAPDGTLYAAAGADDFQAMYTIDIVKGTATGLGIHPEDIRGMEFLSIPEPATICIAIMGVSAALVPRLVSRRRRH